MVSLYVSIGNTVDVKKAYTNAIGEALMMGFWEDDALLVHQERAHTSPIWYTP